MEFDPSLDRKFLVVVELVFVLEVDGVSWGVVVFFFIFCNNSLLTRESLFGRSGFPVYVETTFAITSEPSTESEIVDFTREVLVLETLA